MSMTDTTPSSLIQTLPNAESLTDIYESAQLLSDQIYSISTVNTAIAMRGISRVVPILFSLLWIISQLFHSVGNIFPLLRFTIFAKAFAVAPAAYSSTASSAFGPPFGLNQNLYNIIIFVFLTVVVCIIGVLLYAGFIAKSKNQKAAALVEHFGSFLMGAFFGTKIG